MLKLQGYKKLPKGTPSWLTYSILGLGGCLGISITVMGLIALYGLSGFLSNFFFPSAHFPIGSEEAIYLGLTGVSAALSGTLLSYLAIYMNGLSRKAIYLSTRVWAPIFATTLLVVFSYFSTAFQYKFSLIWVIGSILSIVFGGVLPWLILRTAAGRKVHSR